MGLSLANCGPDLGDGHNIPKCENLIEIVIFGVFCPLRRQYIDPDEIKHVSTDHWPLLHAKFGPDMPREFAYAGGFAAARRCLQFLPIAWPFWLTR